MAEEQVSRGKRKRTRRIIDSGYVIMITFHTFTDSSPIYCIYIHNYIIYIYNIHVYGACMILLICSGDKVYVYVYTCIYACTCIL